MTVTYQSPKVCGRVAVNFPAPPAIASEPVSQASRGARLPDETTDESPIKPSLETAMASEHHH